MPASLGNEMLEVIKKVSLDLIRKGKGTGFNLIVNNEPAGGQVIFHTHLHIIPRNSGDGLRGIV
jgi:histidine triad (HIT) family protein